MKPPRAVVPACPLTGSLHSRLVQWVSTGFLIDLWRYSMGVDAAAQFTGLKRIGLWESPSGLLFFDPPIAGDRDFYRAFYTRIRMHQRIAGKGVDRQEFAVAASFVPPDVKLLDVGCGEGGFRRYVPTASYTGLDPNFGETHADILAEDIEAHAATHSELYDVVCCFQVLEHVSDPLSFARHLVSALRPGGRLFIGVPCWPSLMTLTPNLVVNAPPHHLTLWNERALETLCASLGLTSVKVALIPAGQDLSLSYWMGRAAPKFGSARLFRHAWSWHAGLFWSYCAGRILDALLPMPTNAEPLTMLLVADKPG